MEKGKPFSSVLDPNYCCSKWMSKKINSPVLSFWYSFSTGLDNSLRLLVINKETMNREMSQGEPRATGLPKCLPLVHIIIGDQKISLESALVLLPSRSLGFFGRAMSPWWCICSRCAGEEGEEEGCQSGDTQTSSGDQLCFRWGTSKPFYRAASSQSPFEGCNVFYNVLWIGKFSC